MKEFRLSPPAQYDLEQIRLYLAEVPLAAAQKAKLKLRNGLLLIAQHPMLGLGESELTRQMGEEIRSRVVAPYRVFYRASRTPTDIIAILHGARDIESILRNRLQ